MILENIDIRGFRGINKLSLPLTQTNLLIGDNAWGKSSLLDVLSLLLSPHEPAYIFNQADFHFTLGDVTDPMRRLLALFHFHDDGSDPDAVLSTFWQRDAQGQRQRHLA